MVVSGWGALLAGAQAPKTFSVLTDALACESASRPLTSTCRDCRAWIICTHPHVCWGDRRAVEARGWRVGMLANRRWVGGRSTAECARDERARARQRAFSHQTMSIYPPCSCAPARPPAVSSVPAHSEGAIRGPALPQRNEAQQPAN